MRVPFRHVCFLVIILSALAFNSDVMCWDGGFADWPERAQSEFCLGDRSSSCGEDEGTPIFFPLSPENETAGPTFLTLPQSNEVVFHAESEFVEELLGILHGFVKTAGGPVCTEIGHDDSIRDGSQTNEAHNTAQREDNPETCEPVLAPVDGEPEILFLNWFDNKGHFRVMDMLEKAAPSASGDPQSVLEALRDPVARAVCLSPFGAERSGNLHLGMDLQGAPGTPVMSVAAGRVVFAGRLTGFEAYGRIVVIDHGQGIFSLYGHVKPLKSLLQSKKRSYSPVTVRAGEQVAAVGATTDGESSSGPHLHFELLMVSKEGKSKRFALLNPARYLPSFRDLEPKPVQASLSVKKKRRSHSLNKLDVKADFGRGIFCVLKTLEPVCPNLTGQFIVSEAQQKERGLRPRGSCDDHPAMLKKINPGRFTLLKKMEAFCGMHQHNPLLHSNFNSPALLASTSGFSNGMRRSRFLLPRFLPIFMPDRF
jgi:hypothetical protein